MEWLSSTIDDALFESMLTPVLQQILERVFLRGISVPGSVSDPHPSGVFVFHRELGLILQNAESRSILPKATLSRSWESVRTSLESLLVTNGRPAFRNLLDQEKEFPMETFELLPGRVEGADSLFFWSGSWPWGRLVFLKAGMGAEGGKERSEHLLGSGETVKNVLSPLLDLWMQDATLEVFWSRILLNMPAEYQPVPGSLSPQWFRTVSLSISGKTGKEEILCGRYRNHQTQGWARTIEISSEERQEGTQDPGVSGKKSRLRGKTTMGRAVDIPLNLWGIFDLGFVRIPADLIKAVGITEFFSRLRRSKALALRSLYRHLLYSGKLELLNFWISDSECFGTKMLEQVDRWMGEEILKDSVVAITLESAGTKKALETQLRPFDILFCEETRPDRIVILLRYCLKEEASRSVIPRLLKTEGIGEKQVSSPMTLREFLGRKED